VRLEGNVPEPERERERQERQERVSREMEVLRTF
jgi:hypothetical protein